jgi:hypothetical protein
MAADRAELQRYGRLQSVETQTNLINNATCTWESKGARVQSDFAALQRTISSLRPASRPTAFRGWYTSARNFQRLVMREW